jgi:hypothetical protein
MNKRKFWRRHPVNAIHYPKWLIWGVVAVLVACWIIATDVPSYASAPASVSIQAVSPRNNHKVRFQQRGRASEITDYSGIRLRNRTDSLLIPGNGSYANLGFRDASDRHTGKLVTAGPSPRDTTTEFFFPCRGQNGSFKIGWQRRGSGEGCVIASSSSQSSLLPDSTNQTARATTKSILKAQASSNEVTVSPASERTTLAQTRASGTSIEVYTLQAELRVTSAKYPQGRVIPEGKKYTYPQDTIEDIDRNAIGRSPDMQDFLNPDNWLSPNVPQNVAQGIAAQLKEHQAAFSTTPTSATEFPLYTTVGVSTTPNVQPLTFAATGSTSLTSANPQSDGQFKPKTARLAQVSPNSQQSWQLKAVNLSNPAKAQSPSSDRMAQFPRIPIPGVPGVPGGGTGVIEDAVLNQVARQLAGVLGAESPTIAKLEDAYPTVSQPPGSAFTPSSASLEQFYQALQKGGLTISLPPGDYSVPVHVFCMKASAHAPGSTETFLLAPLKGKQANAISALNSRFVAAGIDRDTIQSLSWAIQAGTKYEELTTQQRAIVDRLIPEFKGQLSQSFWEKVESTWGKVPGAPSLDSAIGKLGPTGELLRTYQQARAAVQQHGDNYSALERAILLPGKAPGGGDSRYPRGIWSKISDRLYARLLPTGLGSPGSLDIRVLP